MFFSPYFLSSFFFFTPSFIFFVVRAFDACFCLVTASQLGVAGEAFFVERVHDRPRRDLVTSPLSSPLRDGHEGDGETGSAGRGGGNRQWEESAGQDDWES